MKDSTKKLFVEFGKSVIKTLVPMFTTFIGVLIGSVCGGGDVHAVTIGAVAGSVAGAKLC